MHCNPFRQRFFNFCFCLTHCRVLPVWVGESSSARKFGHAWRLGDFIREITLNDEYLSQFLPERKVLWMTSENLFDIFMKLPIFDSIRAICVLHWGHAQLLVPSGEERPKTLKSFIGILPAVALIRSKVWQKISESYINNMPKAFSWKTYFMSNLFYSKKCHFHPKTWDVDYLPGPGFG